MLTTEKGIMNRLFQDLFLSIWNKIMKNTNFIQSAVVISSGNNNTPVQMIKYTDGIQNEWLLHEVLWSQYCEWNTMTKTGEKKMDFCYIVCFSSNLIIKTHLAFFNYKNICWSQHEQINLTS